MLSNNSVTGAGTLVRGNAPEATIVALGNRLYHDADILPVDGARKIFAGNVYSYQWVTGDPAEPHARFVNPDVTLEDYVDIPPIPEVTIPQPLRRPVADLALPGMADVTTEPYNAVGDGIADDSDAIQHAFDDSKLVYLPPGTYRIGKPVGFVHTIYGGVNRPAGGWIAGAGSGLTTILRDPADKGSVFLSDGMAYATVQGITFETAAWDPADPDPIDEPAVALENVPGFGHATQEVMFYDCRFIGGKQALGFGLVTDTNCSENLMVDCEFADAEFGLSTGSYNALANIVYNGTFRDNEIAMGHSGTLMAGTWAVLHGSITGTRRKDFEFLNSASGIWYFHGMSSDSPKFFQRAGGTGASFPLLFDHCTLAPAVPQDPVFELITSGGPMFLDSTLDPGTTLHGGGLSVNYGFKLHSEIPAWDAATVVVEVEGLAFAADKQQLTWLSLQPPPGSGTTFEVYRELESGDHVGSGQGAACVATGVDQPGWRVEALPPAGAALRYLVRGVNACGGGPWGAASDSTPRAAVCPFVFHRKSVEPTDRAATSWPLAADPSSSAESPARDGIRLPADGLGGCGRIPPRPGGKGEGEWPRGGTRGSHR